MIRQKFNEYAKHIKNIAKNISPIPSLGIAAVNVIAITKCVIARIYKLHYCCLIWGG